jgi:hypothetical protein
MSQQAERPPSRPTPGLALASVLGFQTRSAAQDASPARRVKAVLDDLADLVDLARITVRVISGEDGLMHTDPLCKAVHHVHTTLMDLDSLRDLPLCDCVGASNVVWGSLSVVDPLPDLVGELSFATPLECWLFACEMIPRLAPSELLPSSAVKWGLDRLEELLPPVTPPDSGRLYVLSRGRLKRVPHQVAEYLPRCLMHDPRGFSLLLTSDTLPDAPSAHLLAESISLERTLELMPLFAELFQNAPDGLAPSDAFLASALLIE